MLEKPWEISEKVIQIGRARCPILWIQIRTYEKSITYIPVGRALPPVAGSAYGMTSPCKRSFSETSGTGVADLRR
jgi:hypothetical protein